MIGTECIKFEQFSDITATKLTIDKGTGLFEISGDRWRISLLPQEPRHLWHFRHAYMLVGELSISSVRRHANTERTRYTFITDQGFSVEVDFADWKTRNIVRVEETFKTW